MKQLAAQPAAMDATCTLLDLLQQRKTRRFGRGMTLPGGPLQYTSQHDPLPLSREEERYLIYSADPGATWATCSLSAARARVPARVTR